MIYQFKANDRAILTDTDNGKYDGLLCTVDCVHSATKSRVYWNIRLDAPIDGHTNLKMSSACLVPHDGVYLGDLANQRSNTNQFV
jgi:hypothetical protein